MQDKLIIELLTTEINVRSNDAKMMIHNRLKLAEKGFPTEDDSYYRLRLYTVLKRRLEAKKSLRKYIKISK